MQHTQVLSTTGATASDTDAVPAVARPHFIADAPLGQAVTVAPGFSRVELLTSSAMASPGSGFVRGTVVFGVADHAATLALAEPNAALQAAELQFIRPVRADELIVAEAHARIRNGKKRHVTVTVSHGAEKVLQGEFTACLPA